MKRVAIDRVQNQESQGNGSCADDAGGYALDVQMSGVLLLTDGKLAMAD
jgi:hypothetical protein